MRRGYQIGKGLEKPFEKALEGFKVGQPAPDNGAGKNPAVTQVLPDLDKIVVAAVVIPQYNSEAVAAESGKAQQYAEAAGAKLTQVRENLGRLRAEIKRIEADPNSSLSVTAKTVLGQLKLAEAEEMGKEKQLTGISDPNVRAHVEFSAFVDQIRAIKPENIGEVREAWTKVHKDGLRKFVSKDELRKQNLEKGMGPIFFEGQISIPVSASAGQKALEAELRKLVGAAKLSKAASIKERGNPDLTGLTCERPRPGMYYLYSPKREVPQTDGPPLKFSEGRLLVELVDRNRDKKDARPYLVCEIREGEGSLRALADRSQGRTDIPYHWLEAGFVIPPKDRETGKPRRLPDDEFRRALKLVKTIRAVCAVAGYPFPEREKSEAAPAETPAPTPTPVAPLAAEEAAEKVVNSAFPPTPEPSPAPAPAPEKKGKKGKK